MPAIGKAQEFEILRAVLAMAEERGDGVAIADAANAVGVDDMTAAIADTTRLGGRVVQDPVTVPGVSFALIADPLGHVVGLAQQL